MRRFLSRKLLLAVLSAAYLAAQGQYQEAAAVVVGYILAEAGVDAVNASKK